MTIEELLKNLENYKGWTLFLDRDGVLNKKIENGYVLNLEMLELNNDFLEIIPELNKIFKYTIIVTNQRCIGKGLLTEDKLNEIHKYMINEIEKKGGKIDAIFYCPHDYEKEKCNCRKPKIGMALMAKEKFPDIDFTKSVVIGDSDSDMEFAKNIGGVGVILNF